MTPAPESSVHRLMQTRAVSWICGLLGLVAVGGAAEPWTLARAVETALEQSPDARIALARVEAAQAVSDQAHALSLPHLSLQGRYSGTNTPMLAFGSILNQGAFHPGIDFDNPGSVDTLTAAGNLSYTLYNGGRTAARRSASRSSAQAAEHDFQAARHQLAAEVVKAALALEKARESVIAIESGVRALEAATDAARQRFEAGQLLKADLLDLEVELAQMREAFVSARHAASLAAQSFSFVLGLEPDGDPVELVDLAASLEPLTAPDSVDLANHPQLLGARERVEAAASMLSGARGARRPTVDAFARYQYDHGYRFDRGGGSWLAGVLVDMNVFDGGKAAGQVRQSSAELTLAREQLRKAELRVGLDVQRARAAYAEAGERLAVTERAVEQAEESANLSRARFERGSLLGADLISVESRLVGARLRRSVALADERIALVELRRALGVSPLPLP